MNTPVGRTAFADLFDSAMAVWHMGDQRSIAETCPLTVNGAVHMGRVLAAAERDESIARGGDGHAAEFHGGSLSGRLPQPLPKGNLGAFTCHLRAWIKSDGAATLFHWGDGILGVRISTRVAGTDPALQYWDAILQNYLAYAGADGTVLALEAEIALNNPEPQRQSMRIGVPVPLIGADRWHDITLCFSGPKLDLFIDGVLVDEEWPVGDVPQGDSFHLGGEPGQGTSASAFRGMIDTAAVWTRALADEDVTRLAGGAEAVARRDLEILGPRQPRLQYFTPRGHNTWVGDCICYWHDGCFHLFYYLDRRHCQNKFGAGGEHFAHSTSGNLGTWEHHPPPITIEEQYETFGTGSLIFHNGKFYLFYGMHTTRVVSQERTMLDTMENSLREKGHTEPLPFHHGGKYPMGTSYAVSTDGIHFKKSREVVHPSQNPSVFHDENHNHILMLGGYTPSHGLFTSDDLRHWRPQPQLVPYQENDPMTNVGDCQCYFEWNGWHYIIGGISGFWMARHQRGPYFSITGHSVGSGSPCVPRWDIYDGLTVPVVSLFKDGRRILVGDLASRNNGPWGGILVFRELIQHADGTLGMKWPLEMVPETGEPIPCRIKNGGGVQAMADGARVASDAFAYAMIDALPSNARITLRVEPEPGVEAFGVCVGGHGVYEGGCELQFRPTTKHAQWGSPRTGSPSHAIPDMEEIMAVQNTKGYVSIWNNQSPHVHFRAEDFAISHVEGLDKPFTLDIIVKRDKNGGALVDACIDNRRTLITRRAQLSGDRLFLFACKGEARFREITVRPLKQEGLIGNCFSSMGVR